MKNLIIVESPTKAKTISNFLGKSYEVVASKANTLEIYQKALSALLLMRVVNLPS